MNLFFILIVLCIYINICQSGNCICSIEDTNGDILHHKECHSFNNMVDFMSITDNTILNSITQVLCLSVDTRVLAIQGELEDAQFERFKNLKMLHIEGANLGQIPKGIGSVTNLETLWLPKNQLKGFIPVEIGSLLNLRDLNLNRNDLSGPIPEAIGNLENLESLEIWKNKLQGTLPKSIGNLGKNLKRIFINDNKLNGVIPSDINKLINLEKLVLADNDFVGTLPDFDFTSKQMNTLYVISRTTCGSAPQYRALYTDLPSPGKEIIDCSSITPAPIPKTTSPTGPSPIPNPSPSSIPSNGPISSPSIPTIQPSKPPSDTDQEEKPPNDNDIDNSGLCLKGNLKQGFFVLLLILLYQA